MGQAWRTTTDRTLWSRTNRYIARKISACSSFISTKVSALTLLETFSRQEHVRALWATDRETSTSEADTGEVTWTNESFSPENSAKIFCSGGETATSMSISSKLIVMSLPVSCHWSSPSLMKSINRTRDGICVYLDKPRRLVRHANMEDSDRDDDLSITEKLRRASLQSPANIPMLVVVSFHPDAKGLAKKQIEIQRGFPVNAQYIVNEWLFIRTADSEEGFVPYLCCRPMLRRSSMKSSNRIESSYKLYDFEFNPAGQGKVFAGNNSAQTPTNKKKLPLTSQSYLFTNSSSQKKRPDVTSSSCAGDSGVSDCESSSHHPQQNVDLSLLRANRLPNLRSLRSSSNTFKQTGLVVQDLPLKKPSQINLKTISRSDEFPLLKSQLSISSNSAFTQIVKKNPQRDRWEEVDCRRYWILSSLISMLKDAESIISILLYPARSVNSLE